MKKQLLRFGALALAVLGGCAQVNRVKAEKLNLPPLQFPLRSLLYPSGLRVLVEHDERTNLAGVFLVVGSGSTSDPAGKEGLAHYIEHLTFRSRPTARATYWNLLDQAGVVTFNAMTEFDSTTYYEVGLASHLNDMLKLEGKRMSSPVVQVPEAERATELDVVRNELRLKNETGYVGEVLGEMQSAIFPKEFPYSRDIGGSLDSLAQIQRADVESFVREHYHPANMTLLILGNVDLASADKLIYETLPHRLLEAETKVPLEKRLPDAAPPVPEEPPANASLRTVEASVGSPELWLAWSLPRSFDTDAYLEAFVPMLVSGRLRYALADDKDVQSVVLQQVPGVQASILLCRIELHKAEHPDQTLKAVLSEMSNVWNVIGGQAPLAYSPRFDPHEFAEAAFGDVRRAAVIGELTEAQDLGQRGLRRVQATHFTGDATMYSRTVQELTELRLQQVRDYAGPYFTAERARAVLFTPHKKALPVAAKVEASAKAGADARPPAGDPGWETSRLAELFAEPKERSTYQLPNGLNVILEQRSGLPLLSAAIAFFAAPSTKAEAVAVRLVELDSGDKKLEQRLNGSPSDVGAQMVKVTQADSTSYLIEGSSGNTDLLLAMLAEYARSVAVQSNDMIWLKDKVIPEIKRSEKHTDMVARREFKAALFAGSPYGITVSGDDLDGASMSDAQTWVDGTHSPAGATLAVVGDFKKEDVMRMIADSFGNWKPAAAPPIAPPPLAPEVSDSQETQLLVAKRNNASQSSVEFGCLLSPSSSPEIAARHSVAGQVLNERLWVRLRQRLGATYGSSARAISLLGGTSYLHVTSEVESGKLEPVLAALSDTLASLRTELADDNEIAWAKVKLGDSNAAAHMMNRGVIFTDLQRTRLGLPFDAAAEPGEVAAVTAEQIRADMQQCAKSRPTLSILGDEATSRAAFKEAWK